MDRPSADVSDTSSTFTALTESIPSSYGPSTPLLPPRREMPTVRMRSRYIWTWCDTSSPAFVKTKSLKGI